MTGADKTFVCRRLNQVSPVSVKCHPGLWGQQTWCRVKQMKTHSDTTTERPATADVRIKRLEPLVPPARLVSTLPLTDAAAASVVSGRQQVERVLAGEDDRLLVVVGPCSIHDLDAARDYAKRLAKRLHLPFVPCVAKLKHNQPQKLMNNSYQQAGNLGGVFEVDPWPGIDGPVLLVDDIVDSRWTFTVIAALLRKKGSGPVHPLALAMIVGGTN